MTVTAAIDIGTNSTNLVVVGGDGNDLARRYATTRLGEGLVASGSLGEGPIARTVDAVKDHVAAARDLGADSISIVGTAACRRAANRHEFSALIAGATGLDLEILSAADEARLAFAGALVGLEERDVPTLVLDIGGGSTEYTVGVREAEQSASISFGAVVSTEAHFDTDPPRPEDLTNLIGAVADEIEELSRSMPALAAPGRVVGVAGSIVTIAAVEVGLHRFDDSVLHGMELTKDAAEDVFRTLATERLADRVLNPGLPASRADIIVAGCCILVATMRRLRLESITVSTRGLLDGVARRGRLPL